MDIDLILENNTSKNKDLRVTAISEKNMEFLKSEIKNINLKLFYPVKKINLFFEKNNQTKNFLNFPNLKSCHQRERGSVGDAKIFAAPLRKQQT